MLLLSSTHYSARLWGCRFATPFFIFDLECLFSFVVVAAPSHACCQDFGGNLVSVGGDIFLFGLFIMIWLEMQSFISDPLSLKTVSLGRTDKPLNEGVERRWMSVMLAGSILTFCCITQCGRQMADDQDRAVVRILWKKRDLLLWYTSLSNGNPSCHRAGIKREILLWSVHRRIFYQEEGYS